jgi:hypothetical protein
MCTVRLFVNNTTICCFAANTPDCTEQLCYFYERYKFVTKLCVSKAMCLGQKTWTNTGDVQCVRDSLTDGVHYGSSAGGLKNYED